MKKHLLPIVAVAGVLLGSCGGSDHAVASAATPPPTETVVGNEIRPASAKSSAAKEAASTPTLTASSGSGVARTYQQERTRLRQLALAQKDSRFKSHKTKKAGFFSSFLGVSSSKQNSIRYRRPKNNISSLNGLFGRRKGRRR